MYFGRGVRLGHDTHTGLGSGNNIGAMVVVVAL